MAAGIERGRTAGAFSLIEIMFALAIVAVLFCLAVPAYSAWRRQEELHAPSRRMEILAHTARIDAIDRHRPYDVVVRPDSLSLEPAPPGPADDGLPPPYPLPASISVLAMGWGEPRFTRQAEARLRFQPSGLCSPFSVSFERGPSRVSLRFNPLTGAAEETHEFH